MKFNTLYKTDANWKSGRQPKNHLSNEGDVVAFCGRTNVTWMGGQVEYHSGNWFANGVKALISDTKIPNKEFEETTCAYCFAHAFILINQTKNS